MAGERGPLSKPNAIRRNKQEAKGTIATSRPVMPASLPAEAQREWRRVVPILIETGILTSVDRGALVRYCTAWADWVELDAQIAKSSRLIQGRDGNLVRNPLWMLRRDAANELDTLSTQLGLTPVARLRSNIKHEPAKVRTAGRADGPADFTAERKRRLLGAG